MAIYDRRKRHSLWSGLYTNRLICIGIAFVSVSFLHGHHCSAK